MMYAPAMARRPAGRFTHAHLESIDVAYRDAGRARCPLDDKPLVTTTWPGKVVRMVYFLCRECGRIGAIGYEGSDPSIAGQVARPSGGSSRPPPSRQ